MAVVRIMNRKGDSVATLDREAIEAGVPEALSALSQAEQIVRESQGKGGVLLKLDDEGSTRLEAIDLTAEKMIVLTPLAGG